MCLTTQQVWGLFLQGTYNVLHGVHGGAYANSVFTNKGKDKE